MNDRGGMNKRVIGGLIAGLAVVLAVALLIVRPWAGGSPSGTASAPVSVSPKPTAYPSSASAPATTTPSATASPRIPVSPTPPPAAAPNAVGADCSIPPALAGRDLETISDDKVIALTFDAGSANTGVDRILSTLSSTGTPATFFLTGSFAQKYPGDSRTIASRYPIGNHSQTHPDLTTLTDDAVRGEIETARANIIAATGQDPRPYFRFPFGAVDSRVIRIVNQQCMVPFRWTTDSLGWKGTSGGMSVDAVAGRVISGARPGGVVLMHVGSNPKDGTTLDADALPRIIAELSAQGYRFVTLEAILSSAP